MINKEKYPDILLIEDDKNLAFFIVKYLERKGYRVKAMYRGDEGLEEATTQKYGIVIVDIGLPQMNGLNVLKQIRKNKSKTPVIIITDKAEMENEIETFTFGGNIFHKKPINYELLLAQIKSLAESKIEDDLIDLRDMKIDIGKRIVTYKEEIIPLSHSELETLLLIIRSKGNIVTRNDIINRVFDTNKEVDFGAVDTMISRLRKKLSQHLDEELIETVYKSGYRLSLSYVE